MGLAGGRYRPYDHHAVGDVEIGADDLEDHSGAGRRNDGWVHQPADVTEIAEGPASRRNPPPTTAATTGTCGCTRQAVTIGAPVRGAPQEVEHHCSAAVPSPLALASPSSDKWLSGRRPFMDTMTTPSKEGSRSLCSDRFGMVLWRASGRPILD